MATTGTFSRCACCAIALSALAVANALAQGGRAPDPAARSGPVVAAARTPDVRLWSFGDCERNFPNLGSAERKECVRVVGSDEARDARAFHVCELTNEKDRAEAERCKSAFLANKMKAAHDGLVPNRPATPQEPLPTEVLQRVRVIAETAVELDRAAASNGESAAAPPKVEPANPPAATAANAPPKADGAKPPEAAAKVAIANAEAAARGGSWSASTFVTIIGFVALGLLLGVKYRGRVAAR